MVICNLSRRTVCGFVVFEPWNFSFIGIPVLCQIDMVNHKQAHTDQKINKKSEASPCSGSLLAVHRKLVTSH